MKKELSVQINIKSSKMALSWIEQNTVKWSFFGGYYNYDSLQFRMSRDICYFFLRPGMSMFEFVIVQHTDYCTVTGKIQLIRHFKFWSVFVLIFINIWVMGAAWNTIGVLAPIISIGITAILVWCINKYYYDKRLERKIIELFEPIRLERYKESAL